jgi:hypothetical protein
MIYDFDPDDNDDELRGFEAEQRRREAEFHERAATVALAFAGVMAVATVVVLFWRCVLP